MKVTKPSPEMSEDLQQMAFDLIKGNTIADVVSFCVTVLDHVARTTSAVPLSRDPVANAFAYMRVVMELNKNTAVKTRPYYVTKGRG